jgi:tRNA(adenine34) deaminase
MTAADREFMLRAVALAEYAHSLGEAPVGAVIVRGGAEIAAGYNQRESRQSPVAHAEIIAIENAAAHLNTRRLDDCTIYVTLEPCLMCAGAIMQARLKRIVYGAFAEKTGALFSVANVYEHSFGYSPMVRGGVLEAECTELLNKFGNDLRKQTETDG